MEKWILIHHKNGVELEFNGIEYKVGLVRFTSFTEAHLAFVRLAKEEYRKNK